MQFEKQSLAILQRALAKLEQGFADLPATESRPNDERIEAVVMDVAARMRDNYPYHHPLYAGQMLKPPHPVARLAYMLALWLNPNNHALDGGRASSAMEKEAVGEIAAMIGWQNPLGHLTGGGTMANLEALWIAGQLDPSRKIVASEQAHYTHQRICQVLGLKFQAVACDDRGRMAVAALRNVLESGEVGTVVATIGTTGAGAVDPLPEILELQRRYRFRLHGDAAYGGYFVLADNLAAETRQTFARLADVDSLAIDPHKHGLQPYGCGCILFRDPQVGKFYRHDSPYTYFSSPELHLGEISLECSRAGAAAVALWATQKLLPLVPGGEFAQALAKSRRAAMALYRKIADDDRFRVLFPPELDIVVWAPAADRASEISQRSRQLFTAAAQANLHLALFQYPVHYLSERWHDVVFDRPHVECLRSCLMKPEHEDWLERIWQILTEAAVRR